ncbi:hypothetical protein [Flavobacterium sp. CSZ]|uniref:hypothetical protein n=1 Tax=Flavobacterium sp. CSZ TaxID=2783791 RepID=UPI00188A8BCC|nr:hypothetical protein [Flavobacterium sp. CSZ]MBF4487710.1 hypothetical protein [Flavobacterium sp. CSZ]
MQPSDFLTLIGLALAIWSFIPQKERNFILLFFSKLEMTALVFSLFFMLYLMSFDWLEENWFNGLNSFRIEKGIPASIWAYILSLVVIAYPIIKVSFSYFSSGKSKKLITLYNSLLKENEIELLVGYINKYHLVDIQTYLTGLSNLTKEEDNLLAFRLRSKSDKEFEKLIKPKRTKFGAMVYGHIIQNEIFVKTVASKYPVLFATVFKGMIKDRAANPDLVKLYIEIIFESKNQSLVDELKIMNDSSSSILERDKSVDLPILTGLLVNTKVAVKNSVWYPVGEGAIKSLKYDVTQKEFLEKEYDFQLITELWNHKIWIATVYFNYMVRESIFRNSNWHMWLFYFRNMTDLLIKNIPLENNYKRDSEHPSFAHYIIYEQFDIMLGWLELAKEEQTENRVIDTIRCLGSCIHYLCQAEERKLAAGFKKSRLERIISLHCDYASYPDNPACVLIREWLGQLLRNPKGVDAPTDPVTGEYVALLAEAWREFDKVPYTYHGQEFILEEFVTSILDPLGIAV